MTALAAAGFAVIARFEAVTPPALARLGLTAAGNLEGKELRFGVLDTALFAEVTTAASCGAVNGMHDSFSPLGGLVPMLNIQLGEVVFGGVGAGMYGALVYVVLAVFLAGLMVGRTPVVPRQEDRQPRRAARVDLRAAPGVLHPGLHRPRAEPHRRGARGHPQHRGRGRRAPHPHGLSEVLYAYSSATGNNGSAFAGLTAFSAQHPVFYSLTLGLAMFFGRFPLILAALASPAASREEAEPARARLLPRRGRPLRRAARVGHRRGGRAHLLPRAEPRPGRGAPQVR
jgi:K+-transporting ATPase ATPase A chain